MSIEFSRRCIRAVFGRNFSINYPANVSPNLTSSFVKVPSRQAARSDIPNSAIGAGFLSGFFTLTTGTILTQRIRFLGAIGFIIVDYNTHTLAHSRLIWYPTTSPIIDVSRFFLFLVALTLSCRSVIPARFMGNSHALQLWWMKGDF